MIRWSLVACALVGACGKSAKPTRSDAPTADASVVADAVKPPGGDAGADAVPPGRATAPTAGAAKVLQVVIADRVACARRTDGRVRCWGSPWDGRGLPVVAAAVELPEVATAVAIELGADQTLYVVTGDGTVRRGALDLRGTTELTQLEGIDDVVDVRAHGNVPVVLTRVGNVFTPASATPIGTNAVALRHATDGSIQVLHRDGRVSWYDGRRTREVAKLADATALFGDRCAERRTGAPVCWDSGRIKPWVGAANILDRVHGQRFRCDLTASGVACAGANHLGQLGAGPGPDRKEAKSVGLPGKPLSLVAGPRSACAVLDSGEVACWGANDGGQLGDGTLLDRPLPIVVPGLTTPAPPAPSDGRAQVQASSTAMDWSGLPAGCKRPGAIATLPAVVSAYAWTSPRGASLWFADFALPPAGHTADPRHVRGAQRAIELALGNGRRAIDRGRYQAKGTRTARLTTHAAERAPEIAERVDLVIELVDKTWICGQLLAVDGVQQRQPFAARIQPRAR